MELHKSLLLTFLFSLLSAAFAEEVMTLTTSNFEEVINSNPFVLVEFYAPWCGHCKKLAPEYEKAAATLKSFEPKVILAKVDATVEDSLAQEHGVKGFPTLKWFVHGKPMAYTGGRDESTIVSWVQKKTGPAAKILKSAEEFEAFKAKADAVAVGFFESESSPEAKAFLSIAQGDDSLPFGIVVGESVKKSVNADLTPPKVVVYQKFDDGEVVLSDSTGLKDAQTVSEFINANLLPSIITFSQEVASKIFGGPLKHHLLMFSNSEAQASELSSKLKELSKSHKGKALFVIVPHTESRIVDFFGVKETEMPSLRMVHMSGDGIKKYKFEEAELSHDKVSGFIEQYFAGTLSQDLKSEEPLAESEQGDVRVLVGKDFESVVSNKEKDVLVEFYAPWCGHCKKLEPIYNEVGKYFADRAKKEGSSVVIAKMDATANEVERVSISGFPTLKFFPADSDEIIEYDGPRDKEGIISWLEKHAKKP